MIGLYIHIPFCYMACHYCNFHFSTNLSRIDKLIEALCTEVELKAKKTVDRKVSTLYFGGGTPSLLSSFQLEKVLTSIHENFDLSEVEELTIECNPEDISAEKCKELRSMGFNRISLGIQSFQDEDLTYMNRSHNANTAKRALSIIQSSFENFTVDLIYGTPTLSNEQWLDTLVLVVENNIPHISAYALTVESGTALRILIKKNKALAPQESKAAEQFLILHDTLTDSDFEHYEISNFAKDGFFSKHNSNYWLGRSYIGIGPGAHSFEGEKRSWNASNNNKYIKSLKEGVIPEEIEFLTPTNIFNETIMTSLRTSQGLDLTRLEARFPDWIDDKFKRKIDRLIEDRKGELNKNIFALNSDGWLLCDRISSNLFRETL